MISFKQFISEARLVGDFRTDPNKPFHVHVNAADLHHTKPGTTSIDTDRPPRVTRNSTFTFHDAGMSRYKPKEEYKPGEEEHAHSYTHHFQVDPEKKEIDLAPRSTSHHRRANQKIGTRGHGSNFKKSTPILGSDATEMSHLTLRKTLHDLHTRHHDLTGYTIKGDDRFEGMKYHEFAKTKTNQEKIRDKEPITMYHGTSTSKAKDIVKNGLKAGQRGESYSDLINGYSHKNVYLSDRPSEASNYATRQAIDDKSNPAILKVTIHPKDHHKFMPDEDHMNWMSPSSHAFKHLAQKHPAVAGGQGAHMKPITTYSHDELHPTEKDYFGHPRQVKVDHSFDKPFYDSHVDPQKIPAGKDENDYRREIGHDFVKNMVRHASTRRESKSSFAFRGDIHPKNIEVHKTWKKESTEAHPNEQQYYDTHDKMASTVKKTLK
jgi:Poly(ADP-ribose) polymerase catalytic domain.